MTIIVPAITPTSIPINTAIPDVIKSGPGEVIIISGNGQREDKNTGGNVSVRDSSVPVGNTIGTSAGGDTYLTIY